MPRVARDLSERLLFWLQRPCTFQVTITQFPTLPGVPSQHGFTAPAEGRHWTQAEPLSPGLCLVREGHVAQSQSLSSH